MKPLGKLLLRWLANVLGLWIAGRLLSGVIHGDDLVTLVWAGLLLSVINSFVKPLVMLLSLPAILLTLGLFIVVVNGFTVWLTAEFLQALDIGLLEVNGFSAAVLAGLIVGLANYVITMFLEKKL